ncbi:hypothetical protein D3C86_1949880 [compost metagenome]
MFGLKQLLGTDQQALGPLQDPTLFEQLAMIEFEHDLKQHRTFSPRQAQGGAQQGLRQVQFAAQQRLLGQAAETGQAQLPGSRRQMIQCRLQMFARQQGTAL